MGIWICCKDIVCRFAVVLLSCTLVCATPAARGADVPGDQDEGRPEQRGIAAATPGERQLDAPSEQLLQATHRAVFDTFFPIDSPNLAPDQRTRIAAERDQGFQDIANSPTNGHFLKLFADLRWLTDPQAIQSLARGMRMPVDSPTVVAAEARRLKEMFGKLGQNSFLFADLPLSSREIVFKNMLTSPLSVVRRVSRCIKNTYLTLAYGKVINDIAGISPAITDSRNLPRPPRIVPPVLKTHLTYNAAQKRIEGEVDFLIVGSGPAGAMVASQLQKAGYKVLLMDRGPMPVPGRFDGRLLPEYRDSLAPATEDGAVLLLTAAVVGGGANINGDAGLPMSDPIVQARFAQWRRTGRIPHGVWTKEQLLNDDAEVEKLIGTRQLGPGDLSESGRLFVNGARARSESARLRYYKQNTRPIERGAEVTNKLSPLDRLIVPSATDTDNPLTVLPNAGVTRVLRGSHGEAVGVEFVAVTGKTTGKDGYVEDPYKWNIPANEAVSVQATRVILSAGAVGSPVILKNSGVDNPNIGKGIVLQPITTVTGVFDHDVNMQDDENSAVVALDYRTLDGKPRTNFILLPARYVPMQILPWMPGSRDQILDYAKHFKRTSSIFVNVFDTTEPENRVEVVNGKPVVSYHLSEPTQQTLSYAISEAAKNLLAAGAKAVFASTNAMPAEGDGLTFKMITTMAEADALKDLPIWPNQIALHATQLMTTDSMGTSAQDSVVNGENQVWGVPNLYVVDAGVFPDTVSTHPMQTIYTTAKIFSDSMIRRL